MSVYFKFIGILFRYLAYFYGFLVSRVNSLLMGLKGLGLFFTMGVGVYFCGASSMVEELPLSLSTANHYFEKGDYSEAQAVYQKLAQLPLTLEERRFVSFRLADSAWRIRLEKGIIDSSSLIRTRQDLKSLLESLELMNPFNRALIAEIESALADTYWLPLVGRDVEQAKQYYCLALESWSQAPGLQKAHQAYFSILHRALIPPFQKRPNTLILPASYWSTALQIARDDVERGFVHYGLARAYTLEATLPDSHTLAALHFERAIELGKHAFWLGECLFYYGQWAEQGGGLLIDGRVRLPVEPNLLLAKSLYEQALQVPGAEKNFYFQEATQSLIRLKEPVLLIQIPKAFTHAEDIYFELQCQYVETVELSLYPIDLGDVVNFDLLHSHGKTFDGDWLSAVDVSTKTPISQFSIKIPEGHSLLEEAIQVSFPRSLNKGAYLVEGIAGKQSARGLLLIGQLALLAESIEDSLWVYAFNGKSSEPAKSVHVTCWTYSSASDEDPGVWTKRVGMSNQEGFISFQLPYGMRTKAYFITACAPTGESAYVTTHLLPSSDCDSILDFSTFTDRNAYQVGDLMHWRLNLMVNEENPSLSTYGRLFYLIEDEGGQLIAEGLVDQEEGSVRGELMIKPSYLPGPYFIQLMSEAGSAMSPKKAFFCIEQFRLPSLSLIFESYNANNEKEHSFLKGEEIFLKAEAKSKAGAVLASCLVELEIYQNSINAGELGRLCERRTLQTDEHGRLSSSFIPPLLEEDIVFTFVLRFPGLGEKAFPIYQRVIVMQERYLARLRTKNTVVSPGNKVKLDLEIRDHWGKPFAREGNLRIFKEGSIEEDVLQLIFNTDATGKGSLELELPKTGHYTLLWMGSEDLQSIYPLQSSLEIWVLPEGPSQGVESSGNFSILTPELACQGGEAIPLLFNLPSTEGSLILSLVSNKLLDWQRIKPSSKTYRVDLKSHSDWAPIVYLHATWISDYQVYTHTVPLLVSDAKKNLEIIATWDKESYRPGDLAECCIQVKNEKGNASFAEIAFSLNNLRACTLPGSFEGQDPFLIFQPEVGSDYTAIHSSFENLSYGSLLADQVSQVEGIKEEFLFNKDFSEEALKSPSNLIPGALLEGAEWVRSIRCMPSTLMWEASQKLDAEGQYRFKVRLPEYLTDWDLSLCASDADGQLGYLSQTIKMAAPFAIEVSLPDFFVVGDRALMTVQLANLSTQSQCIDLSIEVEGAILEREKSTFQGPHILEAGQKMIFSQWVIFSRTGQSHFKICAQSEDFREELVLKTSTLYSWPKRFMGSSAISNENDVSLDIEFPRMSDASSNTVYLSAAPNLFCVLGDSVAFLKHSELNCIEALASSLACINAAQAVADGSQITLQGLDEMHDFAVGCVKNLLRYQNKDGGWPWWVGGASDPWMTAYVLWCLTIVEHFYNGSIPKRILMNARHYLENTPEEEPIPLELQAAIFHALTIRNLGKEDPHPDRYEIDLFSKLWKERDKLGAATLARLAMGAHYVGFEEESIFLANRCLRLGEFFDSQDGQSSMIQWPKDDYFSSEEASALAIICLSALLPDEASLNKAIHGLLFKRRGLAWKTVRESSIAALALARHLLARPSRLEPATYRLYLDDALIQEIKIDPSLHRLPSSSFFLDSSILKMGVNRFRLERTEGSFPLILSSLASYRTAALREGLSADAFNIERYYERVWTEPTLLSSYVELHKRLEKNEPVRCGESIETILLIEIKEPTHYLWIKDYLPAGFERVYPYHLEFLEAKSILSTQVDALRLGNRVGSSAFYGPKRRVVLQSEGKDVLLSSVDELSPGFWEIRYRLRASLPGFFHARPAKMQCLYAPNTQALTRPFTFYIIDDTEASNEARNSIQDL